MSDKRKSFLLGALVGSVIGSVTALLLAPKSGRELRQDIKEGVQQAGEKTQTALKQVGEHTSNLVDKAKTKVNDLRVWRQTKHQNEPESQLVQVSSVEAQQEDTEQAESLEEIAR